ncbi:cupin 2 domain-containing protein [Cyanobacterium sp. HL-69]|uniref:cupin domain-containing protein n=1 Tax=Cyanobacterium sp. HL-69 TaxID=2054282 RepID=UPI000CA12A6B|nr:cupin 2 domain-containing protein [Cyanobacterium sp. HL-69]
MMAKVQNLFDNLPFLVDGEDFSELLRCENVVVERIVSSDRPYHKIYNQDHHEWIILIEGETQLKIRDDFINLKAGDYLFIAAQTPHQVIKTSPNCIWLAIHIY